MTLKKLFPISFNHKNGLINMLIGIILYLVIGAIACALIWLATALTGWIPVLGGVIAWVLGLVSGLVGLWSLVGIIVLVLAFLGLVK